MCETVRTVCVYGVYFQNCGLNVFIMVFQELVLYAVFHPIHSDHRIVIAGIGIGDGGDNNGGFDVDAVVTVGSSNGIASATGAPKKACWLRLFRFREALTLTFQPPHRFSRRHSRMSSRSCCCCCDCCCGSGSESWSTPQHGSSCDTAETTGVEPVWVESQSL